MKKFVLISFVLVALGAGGMAYARYATLSSDTPLGISQGCPVISDEVMRKVDRLLKAEKKPVLLWIYD